MKIALVAALAILALPNLSVADVVYDSTGGDSFNFYGPIASGSIEGDALRLSASGTLSSIAVAVGTVNGASASGNVNLFGDNGSGQIGTELWTGSFSTTTTAVQGTTYTPLLTFNIADGPHLDAYTPYWLTVGATGSTTAENLVVNAGGDQIAVGGIVYGSAAAPSYAYYEAEPIIAQISVNSVHSAPELEPGSMLGALTLLAGGIAVMRGTRRRVVPPLW